MSILVKARLSELSQKGEEDSNGILFLSNPIGLDTVLTWKCLNLPFQTSWSSIPLLASIPCIGHIDELRKASVLISSLSSANAFIRNMSTSSKLWNWNWVVSSSCFFSIWPGQCLQVFSLFYLSVPAHSTRLRCAWMHLYSTPMRFKAPQWFPPQWHGISDLHLSRSVVVSLSRKRGRPSRYLLHLDIDRISTQRRRLQDCEALSILFRSYSDPNPQFLSFLLKYMKMAVDKAEGWFFP